MEMEGNFLNYKDHQVHYFKFGTGPKLLFIFHGFADKAALFLNLEEGLKDAYTAIAIDLPFHGKTIWKKPAFTPNDIQNLILTFAQQHGKERFSMMAHSMGGRIVVGVYYELANQIEELILLAPAGFRPTIAYNKTFFNLPARKALKWSTKKPFWARGVLKLGRKMKLIDHWGYNFFDSQLANTRRRNRMFDAWISLYFFDWDMSKFKAMVREKKLPIYFFYGNKDKITPVANAERFVRGLDWVEIRMIEDGHFLTGRDPIRVAIEDWMATRGA